MLDAHARSEGQQLLGAVLHAGVTTLRVLIHARLPFPRAVRKTVVAVLPRNRDDRQLGRTGRRSIDFEKLMDVPL